MTRNKYKNFHSSHQIIFACDKIKINLNVENKNQLFEFSWRKQCCINLVRILLQQSLPLQEGVFFNSPKPLQWQRAKFKPIGCQLLQLMASILPLQALTVTMIRCLNYQLAASLSIKTFSMCGYMILKLTTAIPAHLLRGYSLFYSE